MTPRRGSRRRRAPSGSGCGPWGRVLEGPPALVAVPLLVDGRVRAGEAAQNLAATPVGALLATGRAVLADARRGDEVERARAEAVLRAGEGADRADLHGVAGEIGVERLVGVDRNLFECASLEQLDERVTGDLLREPRAPRTEHAPLAVEQHLRGDGDRLLEGALLVAEAALGRPVGEGLVLQRALAALVADRAVERVVEEQELQRSLLRLLRDL